MAPEHSIEGSIGWRDELASRVARVFSLVYLVAVPVLLFTLEGSGARYSLVAISLTCAACAGLPLRLGKPTGTVRAWLLVGPAVLAALAGFAVLGFLSGPAVVLTLTLVTGGLLLGRRGLLSLGAVALVGLSSIAWGASTGLLPVPDPDNVALTNPSTWMRTIAVTFLAMLVLGTLVVDIVARLETSLQKVRSETLLREQAERARANAEIAANEARQLETLGRLSAGIAHDFNNSLTAIIGCAEVLRGSLPTSMTTRELAGAIIESSERAAALTRELLAYSRKAQMVLKPVDLHTLITGALTLLRASLSSDIRIELRLSAKHSITRADATSLQHAIVNLLVNARDAMPGGGHLTISTREHLVREARDSFDQPLTSGPYLLLEVRDTGTGIDPVNLPKIFEPFFTTKAVGQGTGLGLAAVAGTVRSLGGAIGVETEPGAGTVFRILLPLADAPVLETEQAAALKITQGRGHILLIDDDAAVRNTAEATMTMFGYHVTAVDNGEQAIERVRAARQSFDLVLLDLRMPNLSGPETFDRIHALAPSLPILIWSGYGLEHDVQTLIERGAAGFIQKPYSVSELSQALSLHIAKSPAYTKRSVEHAPAS